MTQPHLTARRTRRTTARVITLLAASAVPALAGCAGGGDDQAPSTPSSFQRTTTPDFSLAAPKDWQVAARDAAGDSRDQFLEVRPRGVRVQVPVFWGVTR